MQTYKQSDRCQNMETLEEYNNLKIKIMYKAIRQLEFNPENYPGETNDGVSETIPGQASTVSEVLLKFSQGTLGNIGMPTYYDYEEEIDIDDDVYNSYDPTLSPDFDLSDAEEYLRIQKQKEAEEEPINVPKATDERTQQISDETKETE